MMITLEEATAVIKYHQWRTATETIPLNSAYFRLLAEDIVADRDLPPFDKAAMDGFACKREDLGNHLVINESLPAGSIPQYTIKPGTCTGIMTGAKVPEGANCVIKQEETTILENRTVVYHGKASENNICYTGEDIRVGDVMLKRGSLLHPQHMGIIASAGKKEIKVFSRCNVGVISTGSELVDPGDFQGETSIMNSNASQLKGQIESTGHHAIYYGIVRDDAKQIIDRVEEALNHCEVVVLTGGASVGAYDLVNDAVEALGFSVKFQKLAIQPGKPVSFASKDDKICFGLSGNPVSCFLQFELLVKPFLYRISGSDYRPPILKTRLAAEFRREKVERIYFLPVKMTEDGYVTPLDYHSSAHLTGLTNLDGFVEIPLGVDCIKNGEEVYVRFL